MSYRSKKERIPNRDHEDRKFYKIHTASEGATGCGLGCLGVITLLVSLPTFALML